MRFLLPFVSVLALLVSTGCSSGGGSSTALTIQSSLGMRPVLSKGERTTWSVSATDATGGSVTLRLLNPPRGWDATHVTGNGTATLDLTVTGGKELRGRSQLCFEARAGMRTTTIDVVFQVFEPVHPETIQMGDVTGDGTLDVVSLATRTDGAVTNQGHVHVWYGGNMQAAPNATLELATPTMNDRLGDTTLGAALLLDDVTGDGVVDIIVWGDTVDNAAIVDTGGIYVWRGGDTFTPNPTFSLFVGGAVTGDQLGLIDGVGVLVDDVTGDGVPDIVAGAQYADVGIFPDAGAVYVWPGGETINTTPEYTLTAGMPETTGQVAGGGLSTDDQALFLVDVTGDGIRDVVAHGGNHTASGFAGAGALFVWSGGETINTTPDHELALAAPIQANILGSVPFEQGVFFVDLTGDGVRDVIALTPFEDAGGQTNSGAAYVWHGGPAVGGAPDETLTRATPIANDNIGMSTTNAHPAHFADVNGDGETDMLLRAAEADFGGVSNAGRILVWYGAADLSDNPNVELGPASPMANDRLGDGGIPLLVEIADVVGDASPDIIATAITADFATNDEGGVFIWTGGAPLTAAPSAILTVPGATASDHLGTDGVFCGDVDGGGAADIVVASSDVDGGANDTGAIYVWRGEEAFSGAPDATLTLTTPVASDALSSHGRGEGVLLADFDGDGTLDIVAGAHAADIGGTTNVGAIAFWSGSLTLGGAPDVEMHSPNQTSGDQYGGPNGYTFGCVDLDEDGTFELLVSTPQANFQGAIAGGHLEVVWGGAGFGATRTSIGRGVGTASVGDILGSAARNSGILLADTTGDGMLEVLISAPSAMVGGTTQAGVILPYGPNAIGLPSELFVPGGVVGDQLGY